MSIPAPKLRSLRLRPYPTFHEKKLSPKLARLLENKKLFVKTLSGRKLGWFKDRLHAKQNLRAFYGWLPAKFFQKTMKKAHASFHPTGPIFLQSLERMVSMVIFRAGFAATPREAKSQIRAGYYTLNGKVLKAPSKALEVGDILCVHPDRAAAVKARISQMKAKSTLRWKPKTSKVLNLVKALLVKKVDHWSLPSLLLWRLRMLGQKPMVSKHLEAFLQSSQLQKAHLHMAPSWKDVHNQASFPSVHMLTRSTREPLNDLPLNGMYTSSHLEVNPRVLSCVLVHPPLHLLYPMKVDEGGLESLYR